MAFISRDGEAVVDQQVLPHDNAGTANYLGGTIAATDRRDHLGGQPLSPEHPPAGIGILTNEGGPGTMT